MKKIAFSHVFSSTTPYSNPAKQPAFVVLITVLIMCLAGCQTLNPYTDEAQTSKATKGAVIGGLGGAAVGAIANSRKGALIGLGIGALAGGLIGNYMDDQEAKLRAQLRNTGVSVTRQGNNIILNMPGNVTFATDSADVSSNFYPVLDSVGLVLNEFKQTYVDVIGFTDNTGAAEYNQKLSERRARSVADYLVSRQVVPERFVVRGMGLNNPIASNATPEGRAQNRRVEIILSPIS